MDFYGFSMISVFFPCFFHGFAMDFREVSLPKRAVEPGGGGAGGATAQGGARQAEGRQSCQAARVAQWGAAQW